MLIACWSAAALAGTTVGTLVAGSSTATPTAISAHVERGMDVVILAGQSNALGYPNEAEGYGTTGDSLPVELQGYQTNVWSWNHTYTAWTNQYLHPHSSVYWGPEITGMDTIHQAYGTPLALVKVAYGSTALYDTNQWQRGGVRYLLLSNAMHRAKATLEGEGYSVKWRQFWWVQGEQDTATNTEYALAYEANFRQFWGDLCADTGMSTNTAIALAPLADHYSAGVTNADIVRAQQAQIGTWPNVDLIVTDDLPFYSGVHYSAASYMEMGRRLAATYTNQFGATPSISLKNGGTLCAP